MINEEDAGYCRSDSGSVPHERSWRCDCAAVIAPELEIWKSALLAGAVSVFKVVESLARASVDGTLTRDEIDAAFGASPAKIAKKKAAKKAAAR